MGINDGRLPEENLKEAVFENDEPDRNEIADWRYKNWLETQFLESWKTSRKKEQKETKR